jgi:hypothetical protein
MDALTHLQSRLARIDNPSARAWESVITDAVSDGARGTMRAWMEAHNGARIETLQATVSIDGGIRDLWTPGARILDATRSTFATLNGSRRDYGGCRVLAAGDETLIIVTPWGDDVQLCVYTTRDE